MHKPATTLTPVEKRQQQLPKFCFWDEVDQLLYIDARKLFPSIGVVTILGWDAMMLDGKAIPDYPPQFKVANWPKLGDFADWKKQIPKWVLESCALFPDHQMTLLHYAGKYPQVLELLDHAPVLAWRLIKSNLEEPEIVALLSGKRTQIVEQVGWPGKAETVKFLTNLRLRWLDARIYELVETCILDESRLQALQQLPRINSMALTLAARFPELIGSQLHQALAQLPCRPMQCQSMVALLEDAYRLAEYMGLTEDEVAKVGQSRYLSEVTELYQGWLASELTTSLEATEPTSDASVDAIFNAEAYFDECLNSVVDMDTTQTFVRITSRRDCLLLSQYQQHAWLVDFDEADCSQQLIVWLAEDLCWAARLTKNTEGEWQVTRVRGKDTVLADAEALTQLELWSATQAFDVKA
jgi:hypothetical protein